MEQTYRCIRSGCVLMILNVLLLYPQVNGQTLVKNDTIKGVWSIAGSPYYIKGNIHVSKNTKLTIDPGVEVKFTGPYSLYVEGILIAKGSAKLPIHFNMVDSIEMSIYGSKSDTLKIKDCNTNWKGIKFITTNLSSDSSLFDHCYISKVNATWGESNDCTGGAISVMGKRNLTIQNCVITNNKAIIGGAIFSRGADVLISNCTISNNSSHSDGGAFYFNKCSPRLINNKISENHSNEFGGGLVCDESNSLLINNLFSGNTARFGGAIALRNSEAKLINNTIANNKAIENGGGIHCDNSMPEIVNSIIWGNHSNQKMDQLYLYRNSSPDISWTNIQYGYKGVVWAKDMPVNDLEGLMDVMQHEPMFTDNEDTKYALDENSPYIDAGNTNLKNQTESTDIIGKPRIEGGYIDLGAYEYYAVAKEFRKINSDSLTHTYENETISITPNPNNGSFKIEIQFPIGIEGQIRISSINGQVIYEQKLNSSEKFFSSIVTLNCPRGVYITEICDHTGEVINQEKLVIE